MFPCAAKMDGSAVYTGTKSVFIHDEFTTKNRWPRALLFVNSQVPSVKRWNIASCTRETLNLTAIKRLDWDLMRNEICSFFLSSSQNSSAIDAQAKVNFTGCINLHLEVFCSLHFGNDHYQIIPVSSSKRGSLKIKFHSTNRMSYCRLPWISQCPK